MVKFVDSIMNVFIAIFSFTALLTIAGVVLSWAIKEDLPYLKVLVNTFLLQSAGVVIYAVKKGFSSSAKSLNFNKNADVVKYMNSFIKRGENATIVSSSLSWLKNNSELINYINEKNMDVEIITDKEAPGKLKKQLKNVTFINYDNMGHNPQARFTLINRNNDNRGSTLLVVGQGDKNNHKITEFSYQKNPQVISLALDFVEMSRKRQVSAISEN